MPKQRWPSVRLVFENVNFANTQSIMRNLHKRFLIKSDNLHVNHRKHGAFRITVQVHPEQVEGFKNEVKRTPGIHLDE